MTDIEKTRKFLHEMGIGFKEETTGASQYILIEDHHEKVKSYLGITIYFLFRSGEFVTCGANE